MTIHFAPIQGQTDYTYRRAHFAVAGGIDCYYTPFIRWEHGEVRKKDLRDIDPTNNEGVPVVPQIIAKDRDEMCRLCDILQDLGWSRIDINMGCPFPLQTHAGRGSGLLRHTDKVEQMVREIQSRSEVAFSIKMRAGMTEIDEGLRLMPLFNEAGLTHLTVHPRLGVEQYKGSTHSERFASFYNQAQMPLLYNGDITTPSQAKTILDTYPNIEGIMMGRGLLRRPLLGKECTTQQDAAPEAQIQCILDIHDKILENALSTLHGDTQILNRMQEFWQPLESVIDKKSHKRITKCGNLRNYYETIKNIQS